MSKVQIKFSRNKSEDLDYPINELEKFYDTLDKESKDSKLPGFIKFILRIPLFLVAIAICVALFCILAFPLTTERLGMIMMLSIACILFGTPIIYFLYDSKINILDIIEDNIQSKNKEAVDLLDKLDTRINNLKDLRSSIKLSNTVQYHYCDLNNKIFFTSTTQGTKCHILFLQYKHKMIDNKFVDIDSLEGEFKIKFNDNATYLDFISRTFTDDCIDFTWLDSSTIKETEDIYYLLDRYKYDKPDLYLEQRADVPDDEVYIDAEVINIEEV